MQQLCAAAAAAEKLLLQQQQQLDKHLTEASKTTAALELVERKRRQIKERQTKAEEALKQCNQTDISNAAALQQQQQQRAAAAAELQTLQQQKKEIEAKLQDLEKQLFTSRGQLKGARPYEGLGFRV